MRSLSPAPLAVAALLATGLATGAMATGCGGCAPPREATDTRPWASAQACERAAPMAREAGAARIASWNLRWFPDGTFRDERDEKRATDLSWAACVMAQLNADVIAVQEFKKHARAKAAQAQLLALLDDLTGGRWRLRLDDCIHDNLPHVGFLYDETRVKAGDFRHLDQLNPFEGRCGGAQHPGLAGTFRFDNGREIVVVAVHAKSGKTPRDRQLREETFAALESAYDDVAGRVGGEVLFVGDFNTDGCPDCDLSAEDEVRALDERLGRFSPPLQVLRKDASCTEYADGQAWPLDHVVAPVGMAGLSSVHVAGLCEGLACREDVELPRAHEVLSDHCPLVVSLGN